MGTCRGYLVMTAGLVYVCVTDIRGKGYKCNNEFSC